MADSTGVSLGCKFMLAIDWLYRADCWGPDLFRPLRGGLGWGYWRIDGFGAKHLKSFAYREVKGAELGNYVKSLRVVHWY